MLVADSQTEISTVPKVLATARSFKSSIDSLAWPDTWNGQPFNISKRLNLSLLLGTTQKALIYSRAIGKASSSVQSRSHVRLFESPWTAAHQASLSFTNSWTECTQTHVHLISNWYSFSQFFLLIVVSRIYMLSRVQLFATPWTVAYQAPPSMGFSRQQCLSGLPFPSPRDLPNPGIDPRSPTLQADALLSEPPGKPYVIPIP